LDYLNFEENANREKSVENDRELSKMREGAIMPVILQSEKGWREPDRQPSTDDDSDDEYL